MPRIVVGVDGSEHARRAVRFAVREASLRGATLDVVAAVSDPNLFVDPLMVPMVSHDDLLAAGSDMIDRSLHGIDTDGLQVERIPVVGGTAEVLCEAAVGAVLLVVGSRGHGGFRGLLVGSVTQQVVAHSPCPVLVVVPEDRQHGHTQAGEEAAGAIAG